MDFAAEHGVSPLRYSHQDLEEEQKSIEQLGRVNAVADALPPRPMRTNFIWLSSRAEAPVYSYSTGVFSAITRTPGRAALVNKRYATPLPFRQFSTPSPAACQSNLSPLISLPSVV